MPIHMNQFSINFTLGNVAYILIVFCASLPSLAKYFYMIYRLLFGTLYPTYLSYKALKRKDDQECTRMMMYWIVFALFTFLEGFLDIFVGIWFPFYFESKIVFIFWLISPYGNGAKVLYENIVKQKFEQHEQVIDEFISTTKQFSIALFWKLWAKCSVYINYLLVMSINKAQIFFVQQMNHQNELFFIQNAFAKRAVSIASAPVVSITEVSDSGEPASSAEERNSSQGQASDICEEEDKDTISPPSLVEVFKSEDDDEIELKRPSRKTKRKRRVLEDETSHRPTTRSSSLKMKAATIEGDSL